MESRSEGGDHHRDDLYEDGCGTLTHARKSKPGLE
jgi:hypothetical protein